MARKEGTLAIITKLIIYLRNKKNKKTKRIYKKENVNKRIIKRMKTYK